MKYEMTRIHKLYHLFTPHHSNNQRAKLLHPSSILGVIAFVFVFQFILRTTSNTYPQILGYAASIPTTEVILLTNNERQSRGLPQLKLDPLLSQAAAKKGADMFAKNYWAHVSPTGTQPWFFVSDAGYAYRYAGENLARDFTTASDVVKAWIASPSHKENLLSSRYQDIGVAVIDGKLDGRETTLVVQMFGTKLSSAGSPATTRPGNITVKAAEQTKAQPAVQSVQTENPPLLSQFSINQNFVLILLGVFALVILIDLVVVYKKSLVRWTSKSLAHLVFVVILIIAVAGIVRGQII